MSAFTMTAGGAFSSSGTRTLDGDGEDLITMVGAPTVLEVSADRGNTADVEFTYGSPAASLSGATLNVPPGAARKVSAFAGSQVRVGGDAGSSYRVVAW